MNILYIHRTQARGVEGVHINEIIKALRGLGCYIDIVSPVGTSQTQNSSKNNSKKFHSFISRFMPEIFFEILEIFYNFIAKSKINRLLRNRQYDFIYERYAIFNWAGVRAAKKYGIPIILEINYTSFSPLVRRRSGILKPFAHWIDKKIFLMTEGFSAVSSFLKQHLVDLGVPSEKITVLTNAADANKFNPEISAEGIKKQYGLNNKIVIGFIGGFYPWHGLDTLLDCFAELAKNREDVCLLLIGDGPVKNDIHSQARELKIEEKVIFADMVEPQCMPEYISLFDIAVMPDSNDYGSPMKIYEYMAMAKPVIAPRLGPLEDGINDGKEGILFEKGNKKALLNAIKTLIENKSLRLNMGNAGRQNVISNHTWLKNAEGILALFTRIKNK